MPLFCTSFVRNCLLSDTVLLLRFKRHFSFRFTLEIENFYTIALFSARYTLRSLHMHVMNFFCRLHKDFSCSPFNMVAKLTSNYFLHINSTIRDAISAFKWICLFFRECLNTTAWYVALIGVACSGNLLLLGSQPVTQFFRTNYHNSLSTFSIKNIS